MIVLRLVAAGACLGGALLWAAGTAFCLVFGDWPGAIGGAALLLATVGAFVVAWPDRARR